MDWRGNLRSGNTLASEGFTLLNNAGTYAEHVKGAQLLLDNLDKGRPGMAQIAHQTGKLTRLFEKYERKIKLQHHDPDEDVNSSNIAKEFFLSNNVDNSKASDIRITELRYLTKLKNPPLNPRQFLGARPLSNSAYKNYLHWSRKSIVLEQKLRSYYNIASVDVVQDHVLLMSCLENGTFLPVIDTFWSIEIDTAGDATIDRPIHRLQSADHFDWGRNNIIKTAHHSSEIDSIVLSAINDFLNYQKLARAAFFGLSSSTKPSLLKKPTNPFTEKENHAVTHTEDEKREGDCKVEAILIGETIDGCQHVRPLCTTADVALAMYELADSDVFERGFIQFPHTLNMHYDRWMEGYYRYIYRAKEESYLEYVERRIPSEHLDVTNFLFPCAMCEHKDVDVQRITSRAIPERIREFCDLVVATFYKAYQNVGQVILSIDFDFEAIVVGCPPTQKDLPRAPHKARPTSGWEFQYRAVCFRNVKSQVSYSGERRNAIVGLDGMKKSFLKQYHFYFVEALTKLNSNQHAFIGNGEDRNLPKMMGYQTARKYFLSIQEESENEESDADQKIEESPSIEELSINRTNEEMRVEQLELNKEELERKQRFSIQLLKKYRRDKIREDRRESHARIAERALEDRRASLVMLRKQQSGLLSRFDVDDEDSDESASSSASSADSSCSKILSDIKRKSSIRNKVNVKHKKIIRRRPARLMEGDESSSEDDLTRERFMKEKTDCQEQTWVEWMQHESLAQSLSPGIRLNTTGTILRNVLDHNSHLSLEMDRYIKEILMESPPSATNNRKRAPGLAIPSYPAGLFEKAIATDSLSFLATSNQSLIDYTREVVLADDMEKSVADFCRRTDVLDLFANETATQRLKDKQWEIKTVLHEIPEVVIDEDAEFKRLEVILEAVKAAEGKKIEKETKIKDKSRIKPRKNANVDEVEKTLQSILHFLDPVLAGKLRRGLSNYLDRLRKNKFKKFVLRRRQMKSISEQQVKDLTRFFYSLPQMPDSSDSSDEDGGQQKKGGGMKANSDPHALDSFNLSELIGDLANEEKLQDLLKARAAETNVNRATERLSPSSSPVSSSPTGPRAKTPSTANSGNEIQTSLLNRLSVRTSTPKSADSARGRASIRNRRYSTKVAVQSVLINAEDMIAVDESQKRKEMASSFYYNLFHPSSITMTAHPKDPDATPFTASADDIAPDYGVTESISSSEHPPVERIARSTMPIRNSLWEPAVVDNGSNNSGNDMISQVMREMKREEELRIRRQAMLVQQSHHHQDVTDIIREVARAYRENVENNGNKSSDSSDSEHSVLCSENRAVEALQSNAELEEEVTTNTSSEVPAAGALESTLIKPNSPSILLFKDMKNEPVQRLTLLGSHPFRGYSRDGINSSGSDSSPTSSRPSSNRQSALSRLVPPQISVSNNIVKRSANEIMPEPLVVEESSLHSLSRASSADRNSGRTRPPSPRPRNRSMSRISSISEAVDIPHLEEGNSAELFIHNGSTQDIDIEITDSTLKPLLKKEKAMTIFEQEKSDIGVSLRLQETILEELDSREESIFVSKDALYEYYRVHGHGADSTALSRATASPFDEDHEDRASIHGLNTVGGSICSIELHPETDHKFETQFLNENMDESKESLVYSYENQRQKDEQEANDGKLFDESLLPLIHRTVQDNRRYDPLVVQSPVLANPLYRTVNAVIDAQIDSTTKIVQIPIRPETAEATFIDGRSYPKSRYGRKLIEMSDANDSKQLTQKPRLPISPRPSSAGYAGKKTLANATGTTEVKETSGIPIAFGAVIDDKKQKKERQYAVAIPDRTNPSRPKIGLLGHAIAAPVSEKVAPIPVPVSVMNPDWYSTAAQLENNQQCASTQTNPSNTMHSLKDLLPMQILPVPTTSLVYQIPVPQAARLPITILPTPNIPTLTPPVIHVSHDLNLSPKISRPPLEVNRSLNTNIPSSSYARRSLSPPSAHKRSPSPINSEQKSSARVNIKVPKTPLSIEMCQEGSEPLPLRIEIRGTDENAVENVTSIDPSTLDKTKISSIVVLSPTSGAHVQTFTFEDSILEDDSSICSMDTHGIAETTDPTKLSQTASHHVEDHSSYIVSDIAAKLITSSAEENVLVPQILQDSVISTATDSNLALPRSAGSLVLLGMAPHGEYIPEFFVLPDLLTGGIDTQLTEDDGVNDAGNSQHQIHWQQEFEAMGYADSVASVPPVHTAVPRNSLVVTSRDSQRGAIPGVLLNSMEAAVAEEEQTELSNDRDDQHLPEMNSMRSLSMESITPFLQDNEQLDRLIESIPAPKELKRKKDPLKASIPKDSQLHAINRQQSGTATKMVHATPTVEPYLPPRFSATVNDRMNSTSLPPPKKPSTLPTNAPILPNPRRQFANPNTTYKVSSITSIGGNSFNLPAQVAAATFVVSNGKTSFAPSSATESAPTSYAALSSFLNQQQKPVVKR